MAGVIIMLERIISDIEKALDADCYFAALALALTLPDICGKAEYPTAKTTERYINWYNEYVGAYEEKTYEAETPYLSGEVVYNLRNTFLHEGSPNIVKEKIKKTENIIDNFFLKLEPKNTFHIYGDRSTIFSSDCKGVIMRTYEISVRRLCLILASSAKEYYKNNEKKFNFFNYHISGEVTATRDYLSF